MCIRDRPGTRVYVDAIKKDGKIQFSIKNISENPLNFQADELTERFIRGDVSRSTEGSGLGLSIAKNLTVLQHGTCLLYTSDPQGPRMLPPHCQSDFRSARRDQYHSP